MSNEKDITYYKYLVSWSNADQCFVAQVLDFPAAEGYGSTQEEALESARQVVATYTRECIRQNVPVPSPWKDDAASTFISEENSHDLKEYIFRMENYFINNDQGCDYSCLFCGNYAETNNHSVKHRDDCFGEKMLKVLG